MVLGSNDFADDYLKPAYLCSEVSRFPSAFRQGFVLASIAPPRTMEYNIVRATISSVESLSPSVLMCLSIVAVVYLIRTEAHTIDRTLTHTVSRLSDWPLVWELEDVQQNAKQFTR